ncbi:MAG: disulfide reductase, partial [Candidatus Hydrothermota bacterium]
MESRCLVVGSGISGIAAALDLAEKGKKVLLLEKTPWIGGKLSQLDFQFPNDACGMCQVYSLTSDDTVQFCLRRVLDHPFIEVLPLSELKEFRKTKGGFEVTVESKP